MLIRRNDSAYSGKDSEKGIANVCFNKNISINLQDEVQTHLTSLMNLSRQNLLSFSLRTNLGIKLFNSDDVHALVSEIALGEIDASVLLKKLIELKTLMVQAIHSRNNDLCDNKIAISAKELYNTILKIPHVIDLSVEDVSTIVIDNVVDQKISEIKQRWADNNYVSYDQTVKIGQISLATADERLKNSKENLLNLLTTTKSEIEKNLKFVKSDLVINAEVAKKSDHPISNPNNNNNNDNPKNWLTRSLSFFKKPNSNSNKLTKETKTRSESDLLANNTNNNNSPHFN